MLNYTIRRLLQIIPMMLASSVVVYMLMAFAPGDPLDEIRLNRPNITQQELDTLKRAYGLDQPVHIRYFKWLGRAVQGDFGLSRQYKTPVLEKIFTDALPKTMLLTGLAFVIALAIAIPLGVLAAVKQYSFFDTLTTFITFVGYSTPAFVLGIYLMYTFGVVLPEKFGFTPFPPVGSPTYSAFKEVLAGDISVFTYLKNWWFILFLPVMSLSLREIASFSRYIRGSMLEVLEQDYVRTAKAKGLKYHTIVWQHAFRNALIPLVTLVGLSIPGVMGGALVTETVFNYKGMGVLILSSLTGKDYNLAMVAVLFLGLMILLFNLLTDLAYALVDPRIRYK